jgi:hypothetical protein
LNAESCVLNERSGVVGASGARGTDGSVTKVNEDGRLARRQDIKSGLPVAKTSRCGDELSIRLPALGIVGQMAQSPEG